MADPLSSAIHLTQHAFFYAIEPLRYCAHASMWIIFPRRGCRHLPQEIWDQIISHVDDNGDLFRLLLTARSMRTSVLASLYHHIVLDEMGPEKVMMLTQTLADQPSYRKLIHVIDACCDWNFAISRVGGLHFGPTFMTKPRLTSLRRVIHDLFPPRLHRDGSTKHWKIIKDYQSYNITDLLDRMIFDPTNATACVALILCMAGQIRKFTLGTPRSSVHGMWVTDVIQIRITVIQSLSPPVHHLFSSLKHINFCFSEDSGHGGPSPTTPFGSGNLFRLPNLRAVMVCWSSRRAILDGYYAVDPDRHGVSLRRLEFKGSSKGLLQLQRMLGDGAIPSFRAITIGDLTTVRIIDDARFRCATPRSVVAALASYPSRLVNLVYAILNSHGSATSNIALFRAADLVQLIRLERIQINRDLYMTRNQHWPVETLISMTPVGVREVHVDGLTPMDLEDIIREDPTSSQIPGAVLGATQSPPTTIMRWNGRALRRISISIQVGETDETKIRQSAQFQKLLIASDAYRRLIDQCGLRTPLNLRIQRLPSEALADPEIPLLPDLSIQ